MGKPIQLLLNEAKDVLFMLFDNGHAYRMVSMEDGWERLSTKGLEEELGLPKGASVMSPDVMHSSPFRPPEKK